MNRYVWLWLFHNNMYGDNILEYKIGALSTSNVSTSNVQRGIIHTILVKSDAYTIDINCLIH